MSLLERLSVATGRPARAGGGVAVHSGNLGDIVYSLPTVAALGVERLILNLVEDPGIGGRKLTEAGARFLTPLLLAQPGIAEVSIARAPVRFAPGIRREVDGGRGGEIASGLPLEEVAAELLGVDHVLDRFRLQPVGSLSLVEAHARAQGVAVDPARPWITLPDKPARRGGILLSVTARYRHLSNERLAALLEGFGPITLVGGREERAAVAGLPGAFVEASDALELARLIAECDLFIGVPSLPFAIAEAMKHKRLVDLPEWPVNAFPSGPDGWVLPSDLDDARRLIRALLGPGEAELAVASRVTVPLGTERQRTTLTAQLLRPSTNKVLAQQALPISGDQVTHAFELAGPIPEETLTLAFLLDHWISVGGVRIEAADGATRWRFNGEEGGIGDGSSARFAPVGEESSCRGV